MNNKLLVSMLVSIVIITGIIAFTPVEQASTIHDGAVVTTGNFVSLNKHIPGSDQGHAGGTAFTFVADSDTIITSIWVGHNTEGIQMDIHLGGFELDHDDWSGAGNTLLELRDVFRLLERDDHSFAFSDALPLEAHIPLVLAFATDGNDGTNLTVWITYEGGSGATFT